MPMGTTASSTHRSDNGAESQSAAPTTDKLRESSHEIVDNVADRAEGVEETVRAKSAQAKEQLNEKKEAASEQVEHSVARVETFIKERPLAAAGIAFAAGVFASRMMRR